MRATLALHPNSRCTAAARIEVDVARAPSGVLTLRYMLTGKINDIRIAPPAAAVRTDNLWQHTCFEAFVAGSDASYREFNFAPSTQWAAYQFSGYREGMVAVDVNDPRIAIERAEDRFALATSLDLSRLPRAPWRLALSAVIEEANGDKSYWALAHPPGKPDFHHPDCFTLELPPP